SQQLDQQSTGVDICVYRIAVHDQGNLGHQHSLGLHCRIWRQHRRFKVIPKAIIWAIPVMSNLGSPSPGAWPDRLDGPCSTGFGRAESANQPCTALPKLAKNSSASFLAAPLISRCPSCASLPPICASTSYFSKVPPSFSASATAAPPLAKPATPPSPSPEIR